MRRIYIVVGLILLTVFSFAQSIQNQFYNSADKLLSNDGKLIIGGYGQVDYNQPFSTNTRENGNLDVHRLVLLFGYRFSDKTQFITEVEFEHVKEVYIEQAFIQHRINTGLNFRAGLLLIPMGIINEYHEPTTYNGVERPLVDSKISPTTWREIGFGLSGNSINASLKYQAYIVNGFNSYDGDARLSGANGLRKGRQKGAESFISSPNFTGKIEYYGLPGLNIGLSGYFGKTQSTLYDGIDKNNKNAIAKADSSVVGVSMIGMDARYNKKGFELGGQYYYTSLSNTDQYNTFTAKNEKLNDLGNAMIGFYIEGGYNILYSSEAKSQLVPFIRYETYNTHKSVENVTTLNKAYNKQAITTGIGWRLTQGAVLKADMQFIKSEATNTYSNVFNAGVAVFF